jgi:hypothetical protein
MADARIINTGINANTQIVANRLNYDDDFAILQQGSLRSIRRFFEQKENPDKFAEDPTAPLKVVEPDTSYSINSIQFFVRFMIVIVILAAVWDYLKSEKP